MQVIRWFDRTFELGNTQYIMPSLIERLSGTTIRIQEKLKKVHPQHYTKRPGDSWSLLEQVGHMWDLEELWLKRVNALMQGSQDMPPADLQNRKTHEARHNSKSINVLLNSFNNERSALLARLKSMSREDAYRGALHPRLQQQMTIQDLCMFVADHDDHHLAKMTEIIDSLQINNDATPIIMHTNPFVHLQEIQEREVLPGYKARFVHTGNVTLGFWRVTAGSLLPAHNHLHEQLSIVTSGQFELTVNGVTQVAQPGMVAVIPSNEMHGAVALTDCEIIDVFSPTRIDYLNS